MTLYSCIVRSRRETDGIRFRSEPRQSHDIYSGQECGVPAAQAPKTRPCLASEGGGGSGPSNFKLPNADLCQTDYRELMPAAPTTRL